MNLFLLVVLLLPAVGAIKPKDELRKCYQGVFLESSKKTNNPLTVVESKICVAQLRYNVRHEHNVVLENGKRGNRRICQQATILGEVRPARDDEIMDRWNKATDPPDFKPAAISPGYEIELDDDAEERQQAEANGSVSRRPTSSPLDTEDSLIPAHCHWLPGGAGQKDNVTCYCYTDYCNDGNDSEKFMKLLLSNCYARKEPDETDQQFEAKCPRATKEAVSCLQKPVERALQAKPRPPVELVRNNTDNTSIDSITWGPDDEFGNKYTTAPSTIPSAGQGTGTPDDGSSTKTIIIATCGGLFVLFGGGFGIFFCIRRRRVKRRQREEEAELEEGGDDDGEGSAAGGEEAAEDGEVTGREAPPAEDSHFSGSDKPSGGQTGSDEMNRQQSKKRVTPEEDTSEGMLKGAAKKIRVPSMPDFGGDDSGSGTRIGGEASDSAGGGEGGGAVQPRGQKDKKDQKGKGKEQKGKKSNEGKGKKTTSKDKGGKGKKQGKSKEKKAGGKKGKPKPKKKPTRGRRTRRKK